MKSLKVILNSFIVILALSLVSNSSASITIIDFEQYPNGDPVPGGAEIIAQYGSWGVTFDSVAAPSATQVTTIVDYVDTPSGTNSLAPGGPAPYNGGTLIMLFTTAVTEVGSYFVDDQFPVTVNAYDALDNLVGTDISDGNSIGFDSWNISYAQGISRVEMLGGYWSYPDSPDGWGIDDLTFSPVPEPATIALLGFGSLTLLRKKRSV